MTYITHNPGVALIGLLMMALVGALIVGSSHTRRNRRQTLIKEADAVIFALYPQRRVEYRGTRHVRFTLPVMGFDRPWTLYFDASRQRFWLENPYPIDYDLPIVANIKGNFTLTADCVGDWLMRCCALQAFAIPAPQISQN